MITGRSASRSSAAARVERAAVGRRAAQRVGQRRPALGVGVGLHEDVVEREVEERRARVRRARAAPARRRPGPGSRPSIAPSRPASSAGATNGTWSISCSEPWPQRIAGARPPSTSIGEWFCCAEAIALIPLVTPGPGGQRGDARLARDLRPALGGERRGLLVADVDEVDALRAAAVVDREQVPARQREQLGHAVGLQPPGDQPPAVQRRRLLRLSAHGGELPPGRGVGPRCACDARARASGYVRRYGERSDDDPRRGPRAAARRVRSR